MAYENANIETIARGICIKEGHLLVCQPAKGGRCYLPGGHIEFGEIARTALVREIAEEMNQTATAGAFLGTSEDTFMQEGEQHCEINLYFALDIPAITPQQGDPTAAETWIAFRWIPCTQAALTAANLLPAHLINTLSTPLQTPFHTAFAN